MNVFDLFLLNLRVRIISAAPEQMLTKLNRSGLRLNNIKRLSDLETELIISQSALHRLEEIVQRSGGEINVVKKEGILWNLRTLTRRPVLLFGLILLLFLILFLPTRILFIDVKNNQHVETSRIIDEVQNVGIYFGAARSKVRSEKVKNLLLSSIPDLQWVGVNTRGCLAVITVKERNIGSVENDTLNVSSIVANQDGIIDEITVHRGNLICKVGQAVAEGQVLVSGYTDCGISIKATAAQAEIYARTYHEHEIVVPALHTIRTKIQSKRERFSLVFGKKQIKLYNDGGILGAECVKMCSVYHLTLPGGYMLPISMIKETLIFYNTEDKIIGEEDAYTSASTIGQSYTINNMVAGSILQETTEMHTEDLKYTFCGKYFCREMIGRVRKEEIMDGYKQGS